MQRLTSENGWKTTSVEPVGSAAQTANLRLWGSNALERQILRMHRFKTALYRAFHAALCMSMRAVPCCAVPRLLIFW